MKKIGYLCFFLLCLTACAVKEAPSVEPEAKDKAVVVPEEPEKPRRILSEEEIEYTNRAENSNGFFLAEREEAGGNFLEFTRPEVPGFSLRINQDFPEAMVEYSGKAMMLEWVEVPDFEDSPWYVSAGYGGAVSGYSMPFWVDMTGDGQPELAWLRSVSGTGFHNAICTIYNISSQGEIIPLVEPWEEMAAAVAVEPLDWENNCIRCRITDSDGQTQTGWQWAQEEGWSKCRYVPGKSGWVSLEIDQERGVLEAAMLFGLENPAAAGAAGYMGELRAELAYDAERNAVLCSGRVRVSVFERTGQ